MAILSQQEFMNRVNGMIGESTDEDSLSFIEDMNDTYNDLTSKIGDGTDWKSKYTDLAKKYKERFTQGTVSKPDEEEPDPTPELTKFSDLFTRKEGK